MYFGHEKEFKTREQLSTAIDEYIEYYNKERIQMKLGYLPPLIFREKIAWHYFMSSFEGSPHSAGGMAQPYKGMLPTSAGSRPEYDNSRISSSGHC